LGERLIHDGDFLPLWTITLIDVPAADQRNPQRLKVFGRDCADADRRLVALDRRRSLNLREDDQAEAAAASLSRRD